MFHVTWFSPQFDAHLEVVGLNGIGQVGEAQAAVVHAAVLLLWVLGA